MVATITDRLYGESSSVAVKAPVVAATNGQALPLSGLTAVGSYSPQPSDRILVKDQADPTTNGIYNVSTGAWARTGDFDGPYDATQGTLVVASLNNGQWLLFQLITPDPVIGTTPLIFEPFFSPQNSSYPQTPAEARAGVVPTILTYPEGDIRRYGARLALADNTAAINAAIAVSSAGGTPATMLPGVWFGTATMLANSKLIGAGSQATTLQIPVAAAANTPIISANGVIDATVTGITADYTGGPAGTTGSCFYFSAVTNLVTDDTIANASQGSGFVVLNCPNFRTTNVVVNNTIVNQWAFQIDGAATISGYMENVSGSNNGNRLLQLRSVWGVEVFGVRGVSNGGTALWMSGCSYCHGFGVNDYLDVAGDSAAIDGASVGCTITGVIAKFSGGHGASIGAASGAAPVDCHINDVYVEQSGECIACITDQGSGFQPTFCSITNVKGALPGRVTPSEGFAIANGIQCRIQGDIQNAGPNMTWAVHETGAAPTNNVFEVSNWVAGTSGYASLSSGSSVLVHQRLDNLFTVVGDAAHSWNPATEGGLISYQTNLTAGRILTLGTAAANAGWIGKKVRVSRISGGGFNLTVNNFAASTLVTLAAGKWADLYCDSSLNWNLVATGSVSNAP